MVDRAWSAASTTGTATTAVARCDAGTDVTGITDGEAALPPVAGDTTRATATTAFVPDAPASTARCACHDLTANSDFRDSASTTATVAGGTTRAYHDLKRRRGSARWHNHRRNFRIVTTTTSTTATARAMIAAEL
jgi:hypothetical protein